MSVSLEHDYAPYPLIDEDMSLFDYVYRIFIIEVFSSLQYNHNKNDCIDNDGSRCPTSITVDSI